MGQVFHPAANPFSKATIYGGVFLIAAAVFVFDRIYKSPYVNEKLVIREQPVPFSHKHHVLDDGIDCRYCHVSVERSAFAGIPSVKTCMTCHSQIWNHAPILEPIRAAYETGAPVKWVRVNALPEFVYFNHGIHIAKGVGCVACHGPVGDMPLTWRQSNLEMRWCLSCHEHPERYVGPRDAVFRGAYQGDTDEDRLGRWLLDTVGLTLGSDAAIRRLALGRKLVQDYHIQSLKDCYTCHR